MFERQFDGLGRMRILDGMRYYKKTETQNNVPRGTIRMQDAIDPQCLEHAARAAFARHRVFRLRVVRDDTRLYLADNTEDVVVHPDDDRRFIVGGNDNNGYLTRIGYRGDTISVEFFHGASDGMGVMAFLRTLLYYYCSEKYGKIDPVPAGILLEDTPEDPREYADSLMFIPDEPVQADKGYEYDTAFQLPDAQMADECASHYYEFTIDAAAFEAYMRENRSSRSAVFAWMMNKVIAEVNGLADAPIVAALAVNARKAYGAEMTEQCCVATVPLWYDADVAAMTDAEQMQLTRQMILDGTKPNNIIARAQRTKKFNETLETRFATLEEKQAFARSVNKQGGIKYTYGISYVGEVKFGQGIDEHVNACHFRLCANTIPLILEVAKNGDHYHISYCSHLADDVYVGRLRDAFNAAGIPCTVVQQPDYVESLAVFGNEVM